MLVLDTQNFHCWWRHRTKKIEIEDHCSRAQLLGFLLGLSLLLLLLKQLKERKMQGCVRKERSKRETHKRWKLWRARATQEWKSFSLSVRNYF
jgi:hypothetical protein